MRMKSRRRAPADRGRGIVVAALRGRRRWPWVLTLGSVVLIFAAALSSVRVAWPHGSLRVDEVGLPQVQLARLGGPLVRVSVRRADGASIPVVLRPDGTLWPKNRVAPGTLLFVDAVFRRPAWIRWINGRTQTAHLQLTAPTVRLLTP